MFRLSVSWLKYTNIKWRYLLFKQTSNLLTNFPFCFARLTKSSSHYLDQYLFMIRLCVADGVCCIMAIAAELLQCCLFGQSPICDFTSVLLHVPTEDTHSAAGIRHTLYSVLIIHRETQTAPLQTHTNSYSMTVSSKSCFNLFLLGCFLLNHFFFWLGNQDKLFLD